MPRTLHNAATLVRAGKSLNALFLLDRAWSAVAAPFVFRRLEGQDCMSMLFRGPVLRKYARFVQDVVFAANVEEEIHQNLILSLHLFPSLLRLEIRGDQASMLFDIPLYLGSNDYPLGGDSPFYDAVTLREAFSSAVGAVKELKVHDTTTGVLAWIIDALPLLDKLSINGFVHYDEDGLNPRDGAEDARLFESMVAGCHHLQELDVSDHDHSPLGLDGVGFGETWHLHDWKCLSTLRSLRLRYRYGDLSKARWRFVQHFAATLESLDLGRLPTSAEDAMFDTSSTPDQTHPFPHLRNLTASMNHSTATLLLRRLSPSPLQHLTIRVPLDSAEISPTQLLQLFTQLERYCATLQEVTLQRGDLSPASSAFDPRRVTVAGSKGPTFRIVTKLRANMWTERPLDRRDLDPTHPACTDKRCDAIEEVAQFALSLTGRLRATGDAYGAEAMMLAMEPMRSLMIQRQL